MVAKQNITNIHQNDCTKKSKSMSHIRKPLKESIVKAIDESKSKGRYVKLSNYFTTADGRKIPESLELTVDVSPLLTELQVQKRLSRISLVSDFKLKKKEL